MFLENTEILLFMHISICTLSWYYLVAPVTIFIDRSSKVHLWHLRSGLERPIEENCTVSCWGQYQMLHGIAQLFIVGLYYHRWVNQIHRSHMTNFTPSFVITRSRHNLSGCWNQGFFLIGIIKICFFVSATILYGEYRETYIPKT